jgi:hypothetical protein
MFAIGAPRRDTYIVFSFFIKLQAFFHIAEKFLIVPTLRVGMPT